ncbi:hypothetical protein D8S78_07150 [Natrialba swarupiae]|nr:hypothetical protein [Natrialba swarupiae]
MATADRVSAQVPRRRRRSQSPPTTPIPTISRPPPRIATPARNVNPTRSSRGVAVRASPRSRYRRRRRSSARSVTGKLDRFAGFDRLLNGVGSVREVDREFVGDRLWVAFLGVDHDPITVDVGGELVERPSKRTNSYRSSPRNVYRSDAFSIVPS